MGYLNLSDFITLFSQQSSNNIVQSSNSIASPLINKIYRKLDDTHEIEAGELQNDDDDDVLIPITSTPKDVAVKKIEDRPCRERRSKKLDLIHAK